MSLTIRIKVQLRKAFSYWVRIKIGCYKTIAFLVGKRRFDLIEIDHLKDKNLFELNGESESIGGNEILGVFKFSKSKFYNEYGGALIVDDRYVVKEFVQYPWGKKLHPVFSKGYFSNNTHTDAPLGILVTPEASNNYYHWIIDCIPRLIALQLSGFVPDGNRKILISGDFKEFKKQCLELLGWSSPMIIVGGEKQIYSSPEIYISNFRPNSIEGLRYAIHLLKKEFIPRFKLTLNSKRARLLILRNEAKWRKLIDHSNLMNELLDEDFSLFNPSEMNMLEQAEAFNKAEIIIAVHGAALTNLVFCRKDTLVIELINKDCTRQFFKELSEVLGLNFFQIYLTPSAPKVTDAIYGNKVDLVLLEDNLMEVKQIIQASNFLIR